MMQSGAAVSLPEKLEHHAKMAAGHLASLQAIKAALGPLYASFSDEQKKFADRLKIGPWAYVTGAGVRPRAHRTARAGKSAPKRTKSFGLLSEREQFNENSESSKALAQSGWRVASLWECEINRAASNGELQDFLLSRLTTEGGVASILLNSVINAACDGTPGHPSSEQDINGVLAAVHGIRANDEIEAMLAVQLVATHFAATRALRRLKESDTIELATPTCTTGCS